MKLTIFANFKIDNLKRLEILKISLESFIANDYMWVINIRGRLKYDTKRYLEKEIKKNCKIKFINSKKGWINDSKLLIEKIYTPYIFLWTEDHINLNKKENLNYIIKIMNKYRIDYFGYSWFRLGKHLDFYKDNSKDLSNFFITDYNFATHIKKIIYSFINKKNLSLYILPYQGIFTKKIFLKMLDSKKLLFQRWPNETPFNFEKSEYDIDYLPFKKLISKNQFFIPFDDFKDEKYNSFMYLKKFKFKSKYKYSYFDFNINTPNNKFIIPLVLIREILNYFYKLLK